MHECPECGYACDCDLEDTWHDTAPEDCECECYLNTDDDNDDDDDLWMDR